MEQTRELANFSTRLSRCFAPLALAAAACAAPLSGASRVSAGSAHDAAALMLGGVGLILLGCLGRRSRQVSD
jgi:hypothetical protein